MPRLLPAACLLLCLAALPGCGLFSRAEPLGFRTYTLQGVDYADGVDIVREAMRKYALQHFGGTGITWDPGTANLMLDPVYDGPRRMKLYVHFVPRPPDLDLEMLALVERVSSGKNGGAVGWVEPMMDVPLEKDVYQAAVNELLARRTAPAAPAAPAASPKTP